MLELIGKPGYESISTPSTDALKVLGIVMQHTKSPTLAEIGVGIGATTTEIIRVLGGAGILHLFDFDARVGELISDLSKKPELAGTKLVAHGNSKRLHDSYAWTLAMMATSMQSLGFPLQIYDFIYLDGAHAFQIDAAAVALVKEMIKPGGYLVLDDMYWSFMNSPTMNPKTRPEILNEYSEAQLTLPHIEVIVKVLLETDARFQQVYLDDNKRPNRPVFKRVE